MPIIIKVATNTIVPCIAIIYITMVSNYCPCFHNNCEYQCYPHHGYLDVVDVAVGLVFAVAILVVIIFGIIINISIIIVTFMIIVIMFVHILI